MPKYKLCPRCELNYILESEEYCEVCLDELRGIVHPDYDEDEERVCPICGAIITDEGEYCENCRAEHEDEKDIHDVDIDSEEDTISLDELGEEEDVDDSLDLSDEFGHELSLDDEEEEEDDEEDDGDDPEDEFDDYGDFDEDDYEDDDEGLDD